MVGRPVMFNAPGGDGTFVNLYKKAIVLCPSDTITRTPVAALLCPKPDTPS